MSYVLGLDLGTSSLKAILVNFKGEVIAVKSAKYPLYSPQQGYSEQDPQLWVKAAMIAIEKLIYQVPQMLSSLEAISFSGQMHSLVLLDEKAVPLRNAILWNDVRTTSQCSKIMSLAGKKVINITKNTALEGFTLPKMLWVKENEPHIWSRVSNILMPKDYLGFWMTGNIQMEYSDAAGTLLLDLESKRWSQQILDEFDIPIKILPRLVYSTEKIGVLKEDLARLFGFKNQISIFAGGADNACAALGAGIVREGQAMCSIGTSGVFLTHEERLNNSYDGKLHFFNHVINNSFYSMGVTLAAGHSLKWFKDTFAKDVSYDELLSGVCEVSSDKLLFTPYIVGERTPHMDSQIRASFIGLDTNHTTKHLLRAVLEGVTFSLKESQDLMKMLAGKKFNQIISVGGGAKNKDWLQIQADIFNCDIITVSTEHGPALGAAIIAAVGIGWFCDLKECASQFVTYNEKYVPIKQNVIAYKKRYSLYKDVYCSTKGICRNLMS